MEQFFTVNVKSNDFNTIEKENDLNRAQVNIKIISVRVVLILTLKIISASGSAVQLWEFLSF